MIRRFWFSDGQVPADECGEVWSGSLWKAPLPSSSGFRALASIGGGAKLGPLRAGISILLAMIVVCGCHRGSSSTSSSSTGADGQAAGQARVVDSDETKEGNGIRKQAAALLQARDYDELEALAQDYRTNREMFSDGRVKLGCVYDGVVDMNESASEGSWKARIQELDLWLKAKPESPTAPVALAKEWIDFAWKARGHGYAGTVKDRAWKLFGERTDQAHAILAEAAKLPVKCPVYWSAMQSLAVNEGWAKEEYERLFQEAVRENPGYWPYYYSKAIYLMQRWYGEPGEWEKFAESAGNKLGGDDGDMLYTRIVCSQRDLNVYTNIYTETQISWDRTKHGFELLHEQYPDSLWITSEYCLALGMNAEKEPAKKLFPEMKGQVDLTVWITDEFYQHFREWLDSP